MRKKIKMNCELFDIFGAEPFKLKLEIGLRCINKLTMTDIKLKYVRLVVHFQHFDHANRLFSVYSETIGISHHETRRRLNPLY